MDKSIRNENFMNILLKNKITKNHILVAITIFLHLLILINCDNKEKENESELKIKIQSFLININEKNGIAEDEKIFQISEYLNQTEIEENEFLKNQEFFLQVGFILNKSENYGNFVVYNGKHCQSLIKNFKRSKFEDDCIYMLHIIENDKKDFLDLKSELKYLNNFLKRYPESNLKQSITERMKEIHDEINNGIDIID
ncbi:hypothetical protein EHQ82_05270 [Leptospira selangorensis]|uniref:Outer membrane lipoprotein BamD-like domain-containing protein n=1 Tax=Leptospira selangorensis TaxID=2484982 RepID=A0ABY2NFP7_9LEPT|nr:hypothetical protein [Leptospira selangorensis]TGM23612.1 hypothetical protein EHQ82_05270 [Leptospira selangorensis]